MKPMKLVALGAVLAAAASCADLFGPNTAVMTFAVAVENMVCDDVLRPSVDGMPVSPSLTRAHPVEDYRVEVQTLERGSYGSRDVEYAEVLVALYSERFKRAISVTVQAYEDEVNDVVFDYVKDFKLSSSNPCG